jgi:hypothetical protein
MSQVSVITSDTCFPRTWDLTNSIQRLLLLVVPFSVQRRLRFRNVWQERATTFRLCKRGWALGDSPSRPICELFRGVLRYMNISKWLQCNAEANGGGLALWGSDGSLGVLRTSDATYHAAWLPWITNIGQILASNEITKGGVC